MPTDDTYEALSSFGNQHAKLVNGILARKYRNYNATLRQYKTANGQTEHVKNFFWGHLRGQVYQAGNSRDNIIPM